MHLDITVMDRDGNELNIGDMIQLYDWGGNHEPLGIVKLIWDDAEGRIRIEPSIVEDAYDLWTKAIPRSKKIF